MSEDVKPYGAADDPAVERVDELRDIIFKMGLSQREAADLIEVETRSMRRWVGKDPAPPLMALFAFRYLHAVKEGQLDAPAHLVGQLLASGRGGAAAGSRSAAIVGEKPANFVVHKKFRDDEDSSGNR